MSTTAARPASTNCVTAAATDLLTRRTLRRDLLLDVVASPVHLAIDLLLHTRRVGNAPKRLLPALPCRFDDEVTRPDEPVEEALVVGDVVDALERDLTARLAQHAGPENEPVIRHHDVRRGPSDVAGDEADERYEYDDERDDEHRVMSRAVDEDRHGNGDAQSDGQHERRTDQSPP